MMRVIEKTDKLEQGLESGEDIDNNMTEVDVRLMTMRIIILYYRT